MGEAEITVCIWDTAGQEKFLSLTKNYFQKADGVIVVFDLTDKITFDSTTLLTQESTNFGSPRSRRKLTRPVLKCSLATRRTCNQKGQCPTRLHQPLLPPSTSPTSKLVPKLERQWRRPFSVWLNGAWPKSTLNKKVPTASV